MAPWPRERHAVPGRWPRPPMRVCAACEQVSRAFAQPPLRFPTEVLEGVGQLCEPPLEMPADCGGIPGGPGACDEGAAGVGLAGCGERAVVAMVACGVCRGREAEITHQLAGRIEVREVPQFCDDGDG